MAVTAGALSLVQKSPTSVQALSAAATAGTGPYTYQWYMSTTNAFTPGAGNILSGETALTLTKTGLLPGVAYYFKVVATDTGDSNLTSTSAQLTVTTVAQPNQNQFAPSVVAGILDLPFNFNTMAAQIDISQSGEVFPGQAMKIVDSAGGVPKLVKVTAEADKVFGFINYNIKNPSFLANMPCEISRSGNVMYMHATGAIGRGVDVCFDLTVAGGVRAAAGNTGDRIIGQSIDKASAAGQLIRVEISTVAGVV